MDPKRFRAALNTVRVALEDYVQKRRSGDISYALLCSKYGVGEGAIKWMEEVERELKRNVHALNQGSGKDVTICATFYWTCVRMNVRLTPVLFPGLLKFASRFARLKATSS